MASGFTLVLISWILFQFDLDYIFLLVLLLPYWLQLCVTLVSITSVWCLLDYSLFWSWLHLCFTVLLITSCWTFFCRLHLFLLSSFLRLCFIHFSHVHVASPRSWLHLVSYCVLFYCVLDDIFFSLWSCPFGHDCILFRSLDMTFAVDWALKANYLSL